MGGVLRAADGCVGTVVGPASAGVPGRRLFCTFSYNATEVVQCARTSAFCLTSDALVAGGCALNMLRDRMLVFSPAWTQIHLQIEVVQPAPRLMRGLLRKSRLQSQLKSKVKLTASSSAALIPPETGAGLKDEPGLLSASRCSTIPWPGRAAGRDWWSVVPGGRVRAQRLQKLHRNGEHSVSRPSRP